MGSAENRATEIPGADAAPADRPDRSVLHDLRAGRDRDRAGAKARRTRPHHFHLRCVAIPADVGRFADRQPDRSRQVKRSPCLAMSLKLEMPVVRELLSREEIQVAEAPSDSPAMATGETTVEFLERVLPADGPAGHAAGHSVSERPDSTRDHLPHPARTRRERAFERLPRWEIRATGRQKRSRGSRRTTRSRCGWKISRKSRAWACPRCTIISGR